MSKDVIESILIYYGYDPLTHCEHPEPKVQKQMKSLKKTSKILGESLLEDDPAILKLRVDTNDNNSEELQDMNYSEDSNKEGEDENSEDHAVPSKKTKKQLANPELSWFEVNVIQKIIREKEELAKKLGIDTIAAEPKKASKEYKYTDNS